MVVVAAHATGQELVIYGLGLASLSGVGILPRQATASLDKGEQRRVAKVMQHMAIGSQEKMEAKKLLTAAGEISGAARKPPGKAGPGIVLPAVEEHNAPVA